MFERFIRLFKRSVTADAPQRPQIKKNATLPKKVSFTAPQPEQDKKMHVQDKKQPVQDKKQPVQDKKQPVQPGAQEAKPQTLLLPPAEPEPVIAGKPVTERNISMPLPSSISGEEVAMVQHAVKKTSGERFKYVDKPLKPLVKEEPKKPNDVIKYKIKPLTIATAADHKDATHSDVIVYAGDTRN